MSGDNKTIAILAAFLAVAVVSIVAVITISLNSRVVKVNKAAIDAGLVECVYAVAGDSSLHKLWVEKGSCPPALLAK